MLRMKLNILVSNVIHLYILQCNQSTFSSKLSRVKLNILVSNVIHLYNLQCNQSTFSTTMLVEKYGHLILKFQKFVHDSMPPIFSNLLFSLINIPIYYYYITIQHCMLKKCNFIQLYNETYIQPHIKLILYNRIDYIIIIFLKNPQDILIMNFC